MKSLLIALALVMATSFSAFAAKSETTLLSANMFRRALLKRMPQHAEAITIESSVDGSPITFDFRSEIRGGGLNSLDDKQLNALLEYFEKAHEALAYEQDFLDSYEDRVSKDMQFLCIGCPGAIAWACTGERFFLSLPLVTGCRALVSECVGGGVYAIVDACHAIAARYWGTFSLDDINSAYNVISEKDPAFANLIALASVRVGAAPLLQQAVDFWQNDLNYSKFNQLQKAGSGGRWAEACQQIERFIREEHKQD